jgi:hypothetical protein
VREGGRHIGASDRLLGFGEHYRQIARPFQSTFTRQRPRRLLARIEQRQPELALAA